MMKKLLLGSVLAASSIFTVTACTSVNATTDTTPTAQMQKNHKDGAMRGPMSKLDLTATQQAQIKAIMQNKRGDRTADRAEHQAERAQMYKHNTPSLKC